MAGVGQPAVERLREYLRELQPGARAMLIAELERCLMRGDDFDGAELILSELRRSFRNGVPKAQRISGPARLFFRPLEPFLVDDTPDREHRGRLSRAALEPIWAWIGNTVMPDEAAAFSAQVEHALQSNDLDRADQLARAFQDQAATRIEALLAGAANDDRAQRRFGVQIGTPHAFADVQAVLNVLKDRDSLSVFAGLLPAHIKSFSGASIDSVKSELDSRLSSNPDQFVYSLVLVMSRLTAAWQLIRLATKAASSDDAARVGDTPYSLAVTIVLTEIERVVAELATDLKSGRGIAVVSLLKDIHDAVRGLRSELDLSADTPWSRQLAAVRGNISRLLTAEIELMPGRVRRLMRARPLKEITANSRVDASEVDETEALIGFVVACRNYAAELAINEITQRTLTELQHCLDTGTQQLLDALRASGDMERPFRKSQVDAAIRFCAHIFGNDYAALLSKAADVACGERKAARA